MKRALLAAAITCFVAAVGFLAQSQLPAGRTLLVLTWTVGTWWVFSAKGIRDRWRWRSLAVTLSVLMGSGLFVTDRLVGGSATSSQRVPPISPGANVTQKNVSGPNVIAGGDVTINPEVNQYAPVVTYDFNGGERTSKSGSSEVTAGEAFQAFTEMESLRNARSWKRLAELCEAEIRSTPEWLTPYQYAGEAYLNLGDQRKAIERLEYVEKHAGGNSDYAGSTRLLEQLRNQAKPSAPKN